MMKTKSAFLLAGIIAAGVAQAQIIIVNPVIVSGPAQQMAGSSTTIVGNAITVAMQSAVVGDNIPGPRFASIFIQYDAVIQGGGNAFFPGIGLNFGGNVRGSGQVTVTEQIFGLTLVGNTLMETANPITTAMVAYGNDTGPFAHSSFINSPFTGAGVRVKKLISLEAFPSNAMDIASVSYVNQSVVPEPATMVALGLGAAALIRRRKKK